MGLLKGAVASKLCRLLHSTQTKPNMDPMVMRLVKLSHQVLPRKGCWFPWKWCLFRCHRSTYGIFLNMIPENEQHS